jgi:hypothetical protein
MRQKSVYLIALAVLLGAVANTSADLVGYWPLDGDGMDASGNGLDGTVNGTVVPAPDRTGNPDSAMLFSGAADSHINVGNPPELNITGEMTLAAWVWLNGDNTNNGRIIAKSGGGGARSWSLNIEATSGGVTNPATFQVAISGSTNLSVLDTQPLPTDEWVHMAGVYRPSEATEIYVNGELRNTNTTNIPAQQHSSNNLSVLIGARNACNNCGWDGMIDDAMIFNHALSAGEIQTIMKGFGGGFPLASNPDPRDGALHEDTWVTLSWRPGDSAVSHDVYLGDDFSNVEGATRNSDVFRGNQTTTFYIAGFPGYAYPDGLVPGTTYYWRIDEVNDADPNSPWKGDIWSFSIPPRTAYNPNPADGAEFVGPDNVTLSWTPGFGAKLHTVYLGNDYDQVSNATTGVPAGAPTHSAGTLEREKVYYWRVDESDGVATYKGDIWAFTTPGAAGDPQPANRAVDVEHTRILSWTPAANAASHQIYFGMDKDAVRNATTASPEYKGNRAKGSESYDPGKMAWDTTYFWRVDAVYNTGTVKGLVWTFTTADFLLVDDFESYNDIDPPDPNSNRIFDVWIDGFGTTTNGALVGNDLPPYTERTIVHGGAQSMPYRYDNANKTSEATRTLVDPRDWTQEGIGQLSLWFRGERTNTTERMFVALNGSAVVYHDDPAAAQIPQWTQWIIDLNAFANQGVNLTNVNTITIGLGTKNSPAAGGSGKMYFDDIRLYQPTTAP